MKLCKDCKFISGTKCTHPSGIRRIDYVNGVNHVYYECDTHRKHFGAPDECGPEGIHFRAKDIEEIRFSMLEYVKPVQHQSTFERIKSWLKQKIS